MHCSYPRDLPYGRSALIALKQTVICLAQGVPRHNSRLLPKSLAHFWIHGAAYGMQASEMISHVLAAGGEAGEAVLDDVRNPQDWIGAPRSEFRCAFATSTRTSVP